MKLKTNNKNLSIEPSGWYWLLYILPALFIYIIFMAYPLLDSLRLSFYTGTTNSTREFIGLGNFKKLFTDDFLSLRYKNAFLHTVIFFFINMIFQKGTKL